MGKLNDILNDVGAEMGRLGTQGAAELAAALFNGSNAFVQYGPGQNPVQREPEQEPEWDPLESTCRHASLSIL